MQTTIADERSGPGKLVNEDLFLQSGDFANPTGLRLRGTRCEVCGETFFGVRIGCESCQSEDLTEFPLSVRGEIYSFTVARISPPGAYLGPLDSLPLAVGLIELPEGVRILSPILTEADRLAEGAPVELEFPRWSQPDGESLITYGFRLVPNEPHDMA